MKFTQIITATKRKDANKEYIFEYRDGTTLSLIHATRKGSDFLSMTNIGEKMKSGFILAVKDHLNDRALVIPLIDLTHVEIRDYYPGEGEIAMDEIEAAITNGDANWAELLNAKFGTLSEEELDGFDEIIADEIEKQLGENDETSTV